jgi:hypothetical protein
MDDPTDYKVLFLKAEEERKQAEKREKQEAELRRRAEELQLSSSSKSFRLAY